MAHAESDCKVLKIIIIFEEFLKTTNYGIVLANPET